MDLSYFFSNHLINVGVISWALAQILKTIGDAIKHKQFNKERLAGAGGMPSSHSALMCSVALSSFYTYGYDSHVFALVFIVSLVVMYDATGVRWAAGLHAKAINTIVNYLDEADDLNKDDLKEMIPKLNESLGHRIVEVICGALLGLGVSTIYELCRAGAGFYSFLY